MLYCYGSCGDNWLDNQKGCQQADADAYCKLKFCDENVFATRFEVTASTNKSGFACDGHGTNYGDWLGMTDVYFHDDIKAAHGDGQVVSNVVCQKAGKFNSYF